MREAPDPEITSQRVTRKVRVFSRFPLRISPIMRERPPILANARGLALAEHISVMSELQTTRTIQLAFN